MSAARLSLLLALTTAVACVPEPAETASLVSGPRLLSVRADPPEARPGEVVRYEALLVGPAGRATGEEVRWGFCAAPKALTENNAVSAACTGDAVVELAERGDFIEAPTPDDACALFGPDAPPGDFRPRDPDVTGGYYQPLRVRALGLTGFALSRVSCALAGAPIEVALDFQARYRPNRRPSLGALAATVDGAEAALDHLPADGSVRLSVRWGDDDAETFPVFDPGSLSLVEQREALRVSWFVTAGALATEVTGRAAAEREASSSNDWQAPSHAGPVHLWLVLRDSRGGVDFAEHTLGVGP